MADVPLYLGPCPNRSFEETLKNGDVPLQLGKKPVHPIDEKPLL
jgi:hypothetical protein